MKIVDVVKKPLFHLFSTLFYYDPWVNKHYIHTYLQEVRGDIDLMNKFMQFPKFERKREYHFLRLIEKYERDYCPCCLHRRFSFQNQLQYLLLRKEIDDILSKKDNLYSDNTFSESAFDF